MLQARRLHCPSRIQVPGHSRRATRCWRGSVVTFARRFRDIDVDFDILEVPEDKPTSIATRPSFQRPPPPPPPSPPAQPAWAAAGPERSSIGRDILLGLLGAGVGVLWMWLFYGGPAMETYRTYDSYTDAVKRNALSRIYQGSEVTPEFLMGLDALLEDSYPYPGRY